MKFAVVGGDRRAALLCSLLQKDGHRVTAYALERAELPEEIPRATCLQGCVYGADCVVLPLPLEKAGLLNVPFSDFRVKPEEVLNSLWPGQLLVGGKFEDEFCALCAGKNLHAADIMKNPDFVTANAAITAECALSILIDSTERAMFNSRVLIIGWGRIAKHLAFRLAACGAEVCISARRGQALAMADSLGFETVYIDELESVMGSMDFIVNTVPARVIGKTALCCAESGSVIMELASPPGGFDRSLAANIGLHTIYAPGLPGKCAALSAAELMRDAIYDIIRQQED